MDNEMRNQPDIAKKGLRIVTRVAMRSVRSRSQEKRGGICRSDAFGKRERRTAGT